MLELCDILPDLQQAVSLGFSATPGIPSDINCSRSVSEGDTLFKVYEMPLRRLEQYKKMFNPFVLSEFYLPTVATQKVSISG